MRKTLFLVVLLLGIAVQGCVNEETYLDDNGSAIETYNRMSNLKKQSIFKIVTNSRGNFQITGGLPYISQSDIDYLQSLSQSQCEDILNGLGQMLGDNVEDILDSIAIRNRTYLCEILDGVGGIELLEKFSDLYLQTRGGIDYINDLLPNDLDDLQVSVYIACAVYIDNIARPFSTVFDQNGEAKSRTLWNCESYANAQLEMAGVNFEIGALEAMMTGGAGLILDGLDTLALSFTLIKIWEEYEICKLRWHSDIDTSC